jgi:hypothetical protein
MKRYLFVTDEENSFIGIPIRYLDKYSVYIT